MVDQDDYEATRVWKQDYLMENIVKQNYDSVAFAAFMQSKKCKQLVKYIVDDGMSIDNWTFEDLQIAVQEFRQI